ncbi:MAG: hypothetical protein MUO26_05425 [Methanotrichaceae archaeon]|nr:hypothetical protein [Methanotrichaceae archaeon]
MSESDRVSPYSKTKECGPDEKGYIFLYDSVRKNEKLLVFTVSICDNQYNIIKIDIGKCLKYPLEDNILPIFTIKGMPSGVTQSSDRLFWVCGKNYNNNHFNELVYAQLYYDEGIVSENARITINGILISTDDSTH